MVSAKAMGYARGFGLGLWSGLRLRFMVWA